MTICVDASLVVKWLVPEEGSDKARSLYREWVKKGIQLIAPTIIDYEVGTALRQKVLRGFIHSDDLFPIFDFYQQMNLLLFHLNDLMEKAVAAAASLEQPTIYDVAYLLTAKQQNATFATADKRFYATVNPFYPFVHYFEDLL